MKKRKLVLVILPIILFILLAFTLYSEIMTHFENWAYKEIVEHMSPPVTILAKGITYIGNPSSVLIICLSLLLIPKIRIRYGVPISLSVASSTILNVLLKNIFMRQRPSILNLVTETSYSFPSGHAMINMSLYIMLIFLLCHYLKDKNMKILLSTLIVAFILVIGITRVYLGVHYVTDIIGGWLLGIAVATVVYYFWKRKYMMPRKHVLIDE